MKDLSHLFPIKDEMRDWIGEKVVVGKGYDKRDERHTRTHTNTKCCFRGDEEEMLLAWQRHNDRVIPELSRTKQQPHTDGEQNAFTDTLSLFGRTVWCDIRDGSQRSTRCSAKSYTLKNKGFSQQYYSRMFFVHPKMKILSSECL